MEKVYAMRSVRARQWGQDAPLAKGQCGALALQEGDCGVYVLAAGVYCWYHARIADSTMEPIVPESYPVRLADYPYGYVVEEQHGRG